MTATTTIEKRKPGRPSKLTPDTENRILNAIRCGAPNKVACAAAGIGESTLYQWLDKAEGDPESEYAEFAERLIRARQEGIAARLAIVMRAANQDWRAAAWLLERDLPDTYSMKYRIEHTGDDGGWTLCRLMSELRKAKDETERRQLKEAEAC